MGVINTYTLKSLTLRGGNTASGSSGYGIVNTVNTVAQIGYNLVTGAVQAAANNRLRLRADPDQKHPFDRADRQHSRDGLCAGASGTIPQSRSRLSSSPLPR